MSLVVAPSTDPPSPMPSELAPPLWFTSPSGAISSSPFLIRPVKRIYPPERVEELQAQYFDERVWHQVALIDHLLRFQLRWFAEDDEIFFCIFTNLAPKLQCLTHHADAALAVCCNIRLMLHQIFAHAHPYSSHQIVLDVSSNQEDCPYARIFCMLCMLYSSLIMFFEDLHYDSTFLEFFHVSWLILRDRYHIELVGTIDKTTILNVATAQLITLTQHQIIPIALNIACPRCVMGLCRGSCWTETGASLYQRMTPLADDLKVHQERMTLFNECALEIRQVLRQEYELYIDIAAGHKEAYLFCYRPQRPEMLANRHLLKRAMEAAVSRCFSTAIAQFELLEIKKYTWKFSIRKSEEVPLRNRLDCIAHVQRYLHLLNPPRLAKINSWLSKLVPFVHSLCTPEFLQQYLAELEEDPIDYGYGDVDIPPTPVPAPVSHSGSSQ